MLEEAAVKLSGEPLLVSGFLSTTSLVPDYRTAGIFGAADISFSRNDAGGIGSCCGSTEGLLFRKLFSLW